MTTADPARPGPRTAELAGVRLESLDGAMRVVDALRDAAAAESPAGPHDGVAAYLQLLGAVLGDVVTSVSEATPADLATGALALDWVRAHLAAIGSMTEGPDGPTPRCWALFYEHRADSRVGRGTRAALGANAALGHTLALALLTTGDATAAENTRREAYDRLVALATTWLVALAAVSPVDGVADLAADVVVRRTPALAWDEAERVRTGAPGQPDRLDRLDRLVTLRGRGLLGAAGLPATAPAGDPAARAGNPGFRARDLYTSQISEPLWERMGDDPASSGNGPALHRVMIDPHLDHPGGPDAAALDVQAMLAEIVGPPGAGSTEGVDVDRTAQVGQYVVANLSAATLRSLVRADESREARAIYRVWPDFRTTALINKSVSTVKADAARISFATRGTGIVWAVLDSGIDAEHPHLRAALAIDPPLEHADYTGGKAPLTDAYGHGTHVAGIIAGEMPADPARPNRAVRAEIDGNQDVTYRAVPVGSMSGMAPDCRLVSMKVLGDRGDGEVSAILAALQDVGRINGYGRDLKIHGVNLSVGYPFDPRWFACGQSPICVEVTRLVRSGVVVVVAAGNTGYGYNTDYTAGSVAAGMDLTINDPGNADAAITVGSTHRESPYRYGVSYFSSKGPTGDGRAKPDVVAPGERILSCAAGRMRDDIAQKPGLAGAAVDYVEDSGTSMAAAHLSGMIAAFLSVRPEYVGLPERVKEIFCSSASDLGRVPAFQGRGLVDLMRAIQSV